jgi:hypothetical protein
VAKVYRAPVARRQVLILPEGYEAAVYCGDRAAEPLGENVFAEPAGLQPDGARVWRISGPDGLIVLGIDGG